MAYELKSRNGQPIKRDGNPVLAMDNLDVKIEQLDTAQMSFVAVASTEDEDRDKDIIRASGWDLKNFKKSPVIPWSHNYWSPPIAKSIKTWVDTQNKRLLIKPKFDANDEFSKMIFNKFANGFLTSFSVGFRGIESTKREPDNWFGGREFTKQELLEVSAVAIPANPNANTNLSFGDGVVKSMLDIGYPDFFARRADEHLFYPINDMGQFTSPKQQEVEGEKGLFQILAMPLDTEKYGDKEMVVGYSFAPTDWDKDAAIEFIKEKVKEPVKSFYYQVITDEQKELVAIEIKEDEHPVVIYEDAKPFAWGDPNSVKCVAYRVYDKNTLVEEIKEEQKDEAEATQDPPPPDTKGEEDPVWKAIAEVSTKLAELVTLVQVVREENKSLTEKLVAMEEKLGHNNVPEDGELELIDSPTPDEMEIELDDNTGKEETPPEVKTGEDENLIEIDEAEMGEIGKSAVEGFKQTLKEQLALAVRNCGRID